jgi:hypothetical protein
MDEIPNKIYVSLGRRGFDPIRLKYCHVCKNPTVQDLELLEKKIVSEKAEGDNVVQEITYKIKDKRCGGIFYIKFSHMFKTIEGKKERVTTVVNILDDKENDLGWLGNF